MKIYYITIIAIITILSQSCKNTYNIVETNTWTLVYENDSVGKCVKGNINTLIEAVRNGKEVRVVMSNANQDYAVPAETMWVKNGIVYMQNTSNISCIYEDKQLQFQNDAYHYYYIVSSNGDRNTSRWFVGVHESKGTSYDKVAIKWFVK